MSGTVAEGDEGSAGGAASGSGAVAGIVPAAGLSTRMGSSKPLLDAGGVAFVERVVGALAGGGCSPVLVVVRHADGPEAAMARQTGAKVVINPDPSDGPISSLRTGLRSLVGSGDDGDSGHESGGTENRRAEDPRRIVGCAFCPVDHPRVDARTVGRLVDAFRESDAPIVVPVYESRRGHPVVFRDVVFPELLQEELPEGARTVVHRHDDRILEVEVEDAGVLVDIDTRGEYREHYPGDFRKTFQDE